MRNMNSKSSWRNECKKGNARNTGKASNDNIDRVQSKMSNKSNKDNDR